MPAQQPLSYEQAYTYALRLLNQRSYSQAILKRKLLQRGAKASDIAAILSRLIDLGIMNDARYAASLVRTEANYHHRSNQAIRAKLKSKGLTADLLDTVQSEEDDSITSEAHRAAILGQRLEQKYARLPLGEKRQKIGAQLYRRGFPYTVIQQVLKQIK